MSLYLNLLKTMIGYTRQHKYILENISSANIIDSDKLSSPELHEKTQVKLNDLKTIFKETEWMK